MYRLRNKQTKQIATPEELKYLRVNTDGAVERLNIKVVGSEYENCADCRNVVSWQPAPEWEVEEGIMIGNKPVFINDRICWVLQTLKERRMPGNDDSTPVKSMDQLLNIVDPIYAPMFEVIGTIYDEVNNEASH